MMDGTDRHCRLFHRLMTRRARLYSEMVTSAAVIHGDRDYLLGFDGCEHPVALQLGGSDPAQLVEAARIGEGYGYDEINLNVGCPSDRVQSGAFGACLMRDPKLVAESVSAMRAGVRCPVTVKCRIGVDDDDPWEVLPAFIETVAQAGCETFIIHARKAWLEWLSPKENRTIPPLDYALVRHIKTLHPSLSIILNGGLETLSQCTEELAHSPGDLDGVMLGRAPYAKPWLLSQVDHVMFDGPENPMTRHEVAHGMDQYLRAQVSDHGVRPHSITRHMLGLFHATPGARIWRQHLSKFGANAPIDIIPTALKALDAARDHAA